MNARSARSAIPALILAALASVGGAEAASDPAVVAAARREAALVVYTDQTVGLIQAAIKAFRGRHDGIDVTYFRGDTSPVAQRFETETAAGRHAVDLVMITDRRAKDLHRKGLLAPYQSPELQAYPQEMWGRDFAWSPYALSLTSFAWNSQRVKAEDAPKTWDDLLDSKWKGKIGLQDPLQGGGAAVWIVTMYAAWGEARWTDYMTRLAAQQLKYNRYLPLQDSLAAGEIQVQVAAYPNYVEPMKGKGAPVEWGTPDPTTWTALSLSLSKHAPHPSAAKLFVDFMLSAEGQTMLAEQALIPARADARPAAYKKLEGARLIPQAHELEDERREFFEAKMRELFGRR